jgi:peptide/nickel transport system substrate-binding protein
MTRETNALTIVQASVRLGDPHVNVDNKDRLNVRFAVHESLVRRDAAGRFVAGVAERWELSEDARVWSFRMGSVARFHDGSQVTVADVVASLERARDPAIGGEMGTQGVYQNYLNSARFDVSGDSLRVTTGEPMADLLDVLVELPVIPERACSGDAESFRVGAGPYRVVGVTEGAIEMERVSGRVAYDQVVWREVRDPLDRSRCVVSGKADIATGVRPRDLDLLNNRESVDIVRSPSSTCVAVICNASTGPCSDRRVRQALSYAFESQSLIAAVNPGAAAPLNGPLTSLHFGHDPEIPVYPFDPERAGALLRQAGFGDGLRLTLDAPEIMPDESLEIADHLRGQFSAIGVDLAVRVHEDRPGYADMVRAKQIGDLCVFDSTPLSTWRVLREKIHSGHRGPWWQGYANPDVDQLLDTAAATPNREQRRSVYQAAYRLIRDDAPWLFLYSPYQLWARRPGVVDWSPGVDGLIRFHP